MSIGNPHFLLICAGMTDGWIAVVPGDHPVQHSHSDIGWYRMGDWKLISPWGGRQHTTYLNQAFVHYHKLFTVCSYEVGTVFNPFVQMRGMKLEDDSGLSKVTHWLEHLCSISIHCSEPAHSNQTKHQLLDYLEQVRCLLRYQLVFITSISFFLSLFCSHSQPDTIILTLNVLPWETCHHSLQYETGHEWPAFVNKNFEKTLLLISTSSILWYHPPESQPGHQGKIR